MNYDPEKPADGEVIATPDVTPSQEVPVEPEVPGIPVEPEAA